jgi:hypothetical protein
MHVLRVASVVRIARAARTVLVTLATLVLRSTLSGAGFDVSGTDPDALPVVPAGFVVTMPAREPLVRNVTMLAFDTRGRLFVALGPQYRHPREDTPGDTVVQLVDVDGDGTFEETLTVNTDYVAHPLNAATDGWPWDRLELHPLSSATFYPQYPRSIQVTGKFGWATVPYPIVQATTILTHKLLRRAREAPFGILAFGEGDSARIARTDPDVAMLIAPYMRTWGV